MRIEDLLTRRADQIDRDWKDQAIEFLQTYCKGQQDKIKELETALKKAHEEIGAWEQDAMKHDPVYEGNIPS